MARPTSLQMKVTLSVVSKPLRFSDRSEPGRDTFSVENNIFEECII